MKAKFAGKVELTLFALRESYIALLPYFILTSVEALFLKAAQHFLWFDLHQYQRTTDILIDIFPILSVASIAYHLAKVFEIEKAMSVILSLAAYFSLISVTYNTHMPTNRFDSAATLLCLPVPIVATILFGKILKLEKNLPYRYPALIDNLSKVYFLSFAFFGSFSFVFVLFAGFSRLFDLIAPLFDGVSLGLSSFSLIALRSFFSQLIFFVGLHGENTFDLIAQTDFLREWVFPHLTGKAFYDLFASFGGAGNSLALALAIFWVGKDKHSQAVARIALPFLVFNVSEILVYGLPVVFNRKLLIPFVLTPIINLIVAYVVLSTGWIDFSEQTVPWTMPCLLSGYWASNGNFLAVLLQTGLLALDVYIYFSFVRAYLNTQSTASLANDLDSRLGLANRMQVRERINFQKAQTFIVNSHIETHKIINLIIENELVMLYQPKVEIKTMSCAHFEALMRLKMQDGRLLSPFFLEQAENAGLAPSIDLWVCEQVAGDLRDWYVDGRMPKISINLHPDTLRDFDVVQRIIQHLKGYPVEFEIIERSFALGEEVDHGIQLLRNHGFTMAIDDFGCGYSSLDRLPSRQVDVIKLDKSLIDMADQEKGLKIYRHIVDLCKDLNFIVVAEGIETEMQLRLVRDFGVDFVQGWYFAPALIPSEAKQFQQNCHHQFVLVD